MKVVNGIVYPEQAALPIMGVVQYRKTENLCSCLTGIRIEENSHFSVFLLQMTFKLDKNSSLSKHSTTLTWLSWGDLFANQASASGLHPNTLSSMYTTPCNHIRHITTKPTWNTTNIKQICIATALARQVKLHCVEKESGV